MKKLKSTVRVTEIYALAAGIARLYVDCPTMSTDNYIKTSMDNISSLTDQITDAIRPDKDASMLLDADAIRDEIIRNFSTLLDGYAVIPLDDKRAAALNLKAIFEKYGKKMIYESYDNESALIESMLRDYSAPAAAADAEKLPGIPEYLQQLRNAEDDFIAKRDSLLKAMVTDKKLNATNIKKRLLSEINTRLLPYLKLMAESNPEKYAEFTNHVQTEVVRANQVIARRAKASENPELPTLEDEEV
ncbi:MAG: hypothetical protein II180_02150 [Proteobacteria bacterium]|nr:hypothetical protein [Pseudomonadota bacterium]